MQPGFGQPGYPQQKKSSNAALWIILGLLVVGGGIFAFVAMSGDEGGGSTGSAEGAVRGFVDAAISGDCERAATYATEGVVDELCEEGQDLSSQVSVESVEVVSETEESATVEATSNQGSETFSVTLTDGEWKVTGIGGSAAPSDGGGDGGGSAAPSDGDDGGGGGGSPEDAVAGYAEAAIEGDCATAAQYVTSEFADRGDEFCTTEDVSDSTIVEDIELLNEVGERATVVLTVSIEGDEQTAHIDLIQLGGEWKVDDFTVA